MSRADIDLNKPLTQEQKEWLLERSMRDEVELNERRFGTDGTGPDPEKVDDEDEGVEVSQEVYDYIMSLSEAELDTKLQHYGFEPVGDLRSKRTQLAIQLQEDEDAREEAKKDPTVEKQKEVDSDPTK